MTFNAYHYADLAATRYALGSKLALEIPYHDSRISIRPCVARREHKSLPIVQEIYTGGLIVTAEVADPGNRLRDCERVRSVRVRRGWSQATLAATLENLRQWLQRGALLVHHRQAEELLRSPPQVRVAS